MKQTKQITDTQTAILAALAQYRFLTVDQMQAIGINTGKSKSHLYRIIADLCGTPALVEKYAPIPIHGKGKFPSLHYLTKKGADTLAELRQCDPKRFKFPKGTVRISRMLVHFTRCVWCEIHVRKWAERNSNTVGFYFNDFDTEGDNRTGKGGKLHKLARIDTDKGERLIPDAAFQLTDADGAPRLFLIEVHNEMRSKRIHEKLTEYREAIADGSIQRHFQYDHSPRILTIFEEQKHIGYAIDAMQKGGKFRGWEPYFYFKTLEDLQADFRYGWQTLNGGRPLF